MAKESVVTEKQSEPVQPEAEPNISFGEFAATSTRNRTMLAGFRSQCLRQSEVMKRPRSAWERDYAQFCHHPA